MSKVLRSLRKSLAGGKPITEEEEIAFATGEVSPHSSTPTESKSIAAKVSSDVSSDDAKDRRGSKPSSAENTKTSSDSPSKTSSRSSLRSTGSKKSKSSSAKASDSKSSKKTSDDADKAHRSKSKKSKESRSKKEKVNEASKKEERNEKEEPTADEALDQGHHFDPAESSEDTDNFVGDYEFTDERSHEEHRHPSDFSCLSPEQIIQAQKKAISEVSELLMIPASNASNLIRYYQWKTEKLLQNYFDNPDKVVKEAGLVGATGHGHSHAEGSRAHLSDVGECLICCEDIAPVESCALTCNHRFCRNCWKTYLELKIKEGEIRINCPAMQCRLSVPDDVIKDLVAQDVYEKYLRFVTKSFVEDNDHVTWCPAPGCGNAIHADQLNGLVVKCSCSYSFCFSCQNEDHRPASCDQLAQWKRKCSDESETSHWLGANTKDCPKCHVAVEKNGGCMHMTCRQCGYEWCWLCVKIWKGHDDFYSCSRYEKASKKSAEKKGKKGKKAKLYALEEEREAKRKALERYLNYYQKFLEFDALAKKSTELLEKAHQKMETLQAEQSTLAEVKFIEKAAMVISDCHVALRNSYIFSYYLEDDSSSEKQLFLFLQSELEKTAATLSTSLDAANILKRRTEVVDLTVLAATKRDNLIVAVDNDSVLVDHSY